MGMFNVLITGGTSGYYLIQTEIGPKKSKVYSNKHSKILRFHHIKIYNDALFALLLETDAGVIEYILYNWNGNQWEAILGKLVAVNTYRANQPAYVEVLDYNKLKVSSYREQPMSFAEYEKSIEDSIRYKGEPVNEETVKKEKDKRKADDGRFRVELIEYDLTTKTEKRTEIKE